LSLCSSCQGVEGRAQSARAHATAGNLDPAFCAPRGIQNDHQCTCRAKVHRMSGGGSSLLRERRLKRGDCQRSPGAGPARERAQKFQDPYADPIRYVGSLSGWSSLDPATAPHFVVLRTLARRCRRGEGCTPGKFALTANVNRSTARTEKTARNARGGSHGDTHPAAKGPSSGAARTGDRPHPEATTPSRRRLGPLASPRGGAASSGRRRSCWPSPAGHPP